MMLYAGARATVRTGAEDSHSFEVKVGIHRVRSLLFAIITDVLSIRVLIRKAIRFTLKGALCRRPLVGRIEREGARAEDKERGICHDKGS